MNLITNQAITLITLTQEEILPVINPAEEMYLWQIDLHSQIIIKVHCLVCLVKALVVGHIREPELEIKIQSLGFDSLQYFLFVVYRFINSIVS